MSPKYAASEKLGAEITELCGYIYAATYRLLILIREFDENGYWELPGLVSCAHWLNFQCGIGMNAAREKVRVAHALAELPLISAAFERGQISYSKVRAITRAASPENEEFLLMIANHGTAHHVEKLVSQYRRAKRLQDIENANRQHDARSLSWQFDDDGSMVMNARLTPENGALVVKALQMAIDRQFEPESTRDEVRDGEPDITAETRQPIRVRRADALTEVAETYLGAEGGSTSTADRYQVVVHVSAETLTGDDNVTAETSHLEDGPHVTAETSRRIACDCSVSALVEDGLGEPLSIGRKSRSIPPPMRRALQARDKGCRFPGCTHQHFIDGHHIKHWADDGETSLDNLVLLCRAHHRLVHEGGFGCERTDDGQIVFRDPDGRVLDAYVLPPPLPMDVDPVRCFETLFAELHLDSKTCVTRWEGESMDFDMAVGGMLRQEEKVAA